MALTATISLNDSNIGYNQQSFASVTISNSGGSPIQIISLTPQILATGAPTYQTNIDSQSDGLPERMVVTAPAGGSVIVPMNFLVFSPQVSNNGGAPHQVPSTYGIGCNILGADGSSFAPTPATVTITPNF